MYKNRICLLLICSCLFVVMGMDVPEFEDAVPEEAQAIADEQFEDFVGMIFDGEDDPANYHFEREKGIIDFGPLQPIHGLQVDTELEVSIEFIDEWISVIYQNGEPNKGIHIWKSPEMA
jgi:hypothetical protein